jgi:hypothetical protein
MSASLAPILEFLSSYAGRYQGQGTGFDGQSFKATLDLQSTIHDQLIELHFLAEDADSAFHEEKSWITFDLLSNQAALWTVSTNAPGVLRHDLCFDGVEPGDTTRLRRLSFRLGAPEDLKSFRQEVTLDVMHDSSIEYRYAWGVPHEKLESKTRAVLRRTV